MKPIQVNITANYKTRHKRRARFARQEVYGNGLGPRIALIPLPLGLGLTLGLSSPVSVRSWEWAKYDYADHSPANAPRWASRILGEQPTPSTRTGRALEAWKETAWTN
jgi:hypothetical protein